MRALILYQSSHWITHACPIAAGDGHDVPGLIDERVPGIAAVVHNIVERFEHPVRQPVLAHELPDVFLAVEFGRARRQRHQGDVRTDRSTGYVDREWREDVSL